MLQFLITGVVVVISTYYILNVIWRVYVSKYSFIQGPPTYPWIGTVPYFEKRPHLFFRQIMKYAKEYNYLYIVWVAHVPCIISSTVEYAEVILSSNDILKKSVMYWSVMEWLGTGLLTSFGSKWKHRRRVITPIFHFSILNDFVEIFVTQANRLAEKFKQISDTGEAINIQLPVSLAALDVICETAMGVKTNAQGESSDYAKAVFSMNRHLQHRQNTPWLWPKWFYQLTKHGREYYRDLKRLHSFTITVVNKRIESRKTTTQTNEESVSPPRKNAFLDMLLDLYDKGKIDVGAIQEEVDMFMFEGHDTTAAGLSWTLYMLGRNPEVQENLHAEIDGIITKDVSFLDKIKECKYLENVIKEGLRMHSPVAIYARTLEEHTVIDGKMVPKGTELAIFAQALHMNPKYWDEPDKFNPDRFGEDSYLKRNPYCYVPFSAGSRNCIGQKFALLEMKVFLYTIMSQFRVESIQKEDEVEACFEIIHRSANGLMLQFFSR